MQAILLTELFTRFRSRKTVVKTSRQFEELYNRVSLHVNLSIPPTISISSFKSRKPRVAGLESLFTPTL
jgi:hypothetical protein